MLSEIFLLKDKKNSENIMIIIIRPVDSEEDAKNAFMMESMAYKNKYSLIDMTEFYNLDKDLFRIFESYDKTGLQGYFYEIGESTFFQYRVYVKSKYFKNSFNALKYTASAIYPEISDVFILLK